MFLCLTIGYDENDPDIPGERVVVNSERIAFIEEKEPNRTGLRSTVNLDQFAARSFESFDVFESVEYIASKLQAV